MSRRLGLVALGTVALAARIAAAQPAPAEAEAPAAGSSAAGSNAAGSNAAGASAAGSNAAGSSAAGSNAALGAGSSGSNAGGSNATGSNAGSNTGSGSGSAVYLPLPPELGAPEVNAAVSPSVVSLGAHFTLFVTATFGAGVEVNLREPVELGAAFEVRRKLSEDRPSRDGRTTREWQIDVTPWELGDLQLAPIAVTFTARGHAGQVQTNPVPLKVIGVLGDMVDDPKAMRGLAPPAGLATRDWFWIWCATAGGAALGVVIAALWLRARRRRRTRQLVGGAIARPRRLDMTGARALERLLAIDQSGVLARDADRKLGYADLVDVIREYLGARYRIAVHDRTSSELLRELRTAATDGELALITGWLERCDLVKYGGQRATVAEARQALDDARALIVATTEQAPRATKAAA